MKKLFKRVKCLFMSKARKQAIFNARTAAVSKHNLVCTKALKEVPDMIAFLETL